MTGVMAFEPGSEIDAEATRCWNSLSAKRQSPPQKTSAQTWSTNESSGYAQKSAPEAAWKACRPVHQKAQP